MADAVVLLLLLVLSLICLSAGSSFSPTSVPVRAATEAPEHDYYTFVAISSLKPKAVCTGHRVSPPHGDQNATWLRLSLSHGPCSPLASSRGRKEKAPLSFAELLRQDQLRVDNIQMMLSAESDDDEEKKRAAGSVTITMEHGPVTEVNVGSANSISTASMDPMATGDGGSRPTRIWYLRGLVPTPIRAVHIRVKIRAKH